MLQGIDALNNLTNADEDEIQKQIRDFFEEMDLDEDEIEKRIGLATDLEKGFRNLFFLMLGAMIVGDSLEASRDKYVDYAYRRYNDAMVSNGFSNDEYYQGSGYIELYAKSRCGQIVDSAILHQVDNYYFTTDHSIAIGEDESNAVANYNKELLAIAQGYTKKTWVTFHDSKVRHSHRLVDGQTIDIFKPFKVGSGLMMFPLDQSLNASMKEIANCRCVCEYSGKEEEESGNVNSVAITSTMLLMSMKKSKRNDLPLTDEQYEELEEYARETLNFDGEIIRVDNQNTAYFNPFGNNPRLYLGRDAYPNPNPTRANEEISWKGGLAHEIIGHYQADMLGYTQENEVLEEVQASMRASVLTPGLSDYERKVLWQDAMDRLSNNGMKYEDVKHLIHLEKYE